MAAFLERMPPPDGGWVELQDGSVDALPVASPRAHVDALLPDGGTIYAEWGDDIGAYRSDWVRVREQAVEGRDGAFPSRVRQEHGQHILSIKRAFEALRPDILRRLRAQSDGDNWIWTVLFRRGWSASQAPVRMSVTCVPPSRSVSIARDRPVVLHQRACALCWKADHRCAERSCVCLVRPWSHLATGLLCMVIRGFP